MLKTLFVNILFDIDHILNLLEILTYDVSSTNISIMSKAKESRLIWWVQILYLKTSGSVEVKLVYFGLSPLL